ncbi:DUF4347 domain-containing protein, partial [Undibacterium sp. TS12]|uniref:DUF4347 domain-containing protein n=1 Tax=Undibacterium sp. TS12 TaxID=2908202 RepID=UPI0024099575
MNTSNVLHLKATLSEHDYASIQAHEIQLAHPSLIHEALTPTAPAAAPSMENPAAPAPNPTASKPIAHDVVFIDSRVADASNLLKGVAANTEVVFLQSNSDGLQQMADYLAGHQVNSVQIVAHGFEGNLWLGKTFLDNNTINSHSDALAKIGKALIPGGDILVYSCNLAAGNDGASFVSNLATLTGADVAASSNRTGAGGDWDLEVTTGKIEATSVLSKDAESHYDHSLVTVTVTNGNDSGAGSLRTAITAASSGDTVTFDASRTVTLSTGQLLISKNLIIEGDLDGNGTPDVTIDANNSSRVINIITGTVTLDGLIIRNGLSNGAGGSNATGGIGGNGSDGFGAGINNSGTLTISNSTITNNKAAGGGGGGGTSVGLYGGGGGGGGGFGSGSGAAGGIGAGAQSPGAISGITGGTGGGANGRGGGGGSATGGAASTFSGSGYTVGGAGATANNGSIGIGGGGGGTGTDKAGGTGGNAAAAIYNNTTGSITILTSTINNNIGAGGGGGGGVAANYSSTGNGGDGGRGVGGIWNASSTANSVKMDAGTYTSLATGNKGVGGSAGTALGGTNINGSIGGSNDKYFGLSSLNNTFAPTAISSATYDASTGTLTVTGTGMVTNDVIVANKLTLTGEGGATYTLTDTANTTATNSTTFSLTLSAADKLAVNGLLNKNGTTAAVGGTTFNIGGAAGWDSTASATADTTGNGVTVSNVAAPTITSATYNVSTNTFVVTGTNLVSVVGGNNDITVSTLTITGQSGGTHTLSTTGNVEVTSATSFTFQLAGADIAAVNALLNKNGSSSSSGTTYNLAATDNWNSVITGGDISDATNAISVTNAPTVISSATYNANTGVLTVTGVNITNGGTIDVSKLSLTGQGGSYTLTAATSNPTASSDTSFTVTLGAADKIAVNGVLNNNGTTSATGAITFNLAAAANWDVTAAAAADLTGNGITVSNVTAPTITSASYDAATGILSVTGTGLVKTIGATNDITVNQLRIVGEGGTGRTLVISSNVEITDATTFSVQLSGNDRIVVDSLLNKNGTTSTSGSTYNVVAFDDWNSSITGGDISDATNPLTVSNVPIPTITSATYDATTGTLVVTGTGFLQLTGANNDIVANKFTLTGEGGSTYTLTDTSNVDIATTSNTQFTLVLSATDKSGINQIINKNGTSSTGGTTYNVAAAEDWTAGADAAVVVADLTGNGVTATVAAPTVTSATYDASTGTLVVTGTGFTHRAGAANDIIANKFTLTGQGGSTYALTDTANVEITSDTSFTLVLSATDKAGLRTLLNNNGTQSVGGTTYNLAAADDWANGADAALNIADTTGNGITVSNVVSPAITSATYDASTGILTVTGTNMASGDAIDVTKLTLTGEAGSYTLTVDTANVTASSATAFSVTLGAVDKIAVNGVLNNNGTNAVDTTTFNLAAAASWDSTVTTSADLTGNGITVSNVTAPTITSATFDGATNILVVTGTGLVKTIGATNDIT